LIVAAVTGAWTDDTPAGAAALRTTIYRPTREFQSAIYRDELPPLVVRAQDTPFFEGDSGGSETPPTYAPSDGTTPPSSPGLTTPGTYDPFATQDPFTTQPLVQPYGVPATGDPWLGGGTGAPVVSPFQQSLGGQYGFGLNGPQPYRYGWAARYDAAFLPQEGTTPDVGSLEIIEVNVEKELVTPIWASHVLSIAPQFNYRAWEGPRSSAGNTGLPGSGFRFGLGLKLATPDYGGWNVELGFNPALATDFENTITSDAWIFDGHAVAFWRWSPQWMVALGAAYWDRVDDMVIPYAGVVWTPNEYWEFRLLFPKPRVSLFLGTPAGIPTWLYASGEYHVEVYELNVQPINRSTQVQFEDWRIVGGARFETGSVTTFIEAGWVFEREIDHAAATSTDLDLDSGFIGRVGLRY
jgi:hypothetical protein